jgi:hypothetical protein
LLLPLLLSLSLLLSLLLPLSLLLQLPSLLPLPLFYAVILNEVKDPCICTVIACAFARAVVHFPRHPDPEPSRKQNPPQRPTRNKPHTPHQTK